MANGKCYLWKMGSAEEVQGRQVKVGSIYGLAGALLFGAGTPLSKLLLPAVAPVMLAALLYIGAATLITLFKVVLFSSPEATCRRQAAKSDAAVLCAVVGLGGVLGPILMLFGLSRISALAGSLLLNLASAHVAIVPRLVSETWVHWYVVMKCQRPGRPHRVGWF